MNFYFYEKWARIFAQGKWLQFLCWPVKSQTFYHLTTPLSRRRSEKMNELQHDHRALPKTAKLWSNKCGKCLQKSMFITRVFWDCPIDRIWSNWVRDICGQISFSGYCSGWRSRLFGRQIVLRDSSFTFIVNSFCSYSNLFFLLKTFDKRKQ